MRYGIFLVEHVGRTLVTDGVPFTPQWVQHYDPEAHDGQGAIVGTDDPAEALSFPTVEAAWNAYQAIPRRRPLRGDGRPNRPLTAYTARIQPLPEPRTQEGSRDVEPRA